MCSIENCKHVVFIDDTCKYHTQQKCSICLESVKSTNTQKSKVLSCNHAFHPECIMEWFATSDVCPTCRTSQSSDSIIKFKTKIQDDLRVKYKDSIDSLTAELSFFKLAFQLISGDDTVFSM